MDVRLASKAGSTRAYWIGQLAGWGYLAGLATYGLFERHEGLHRFVNVVVSCAGSMGISHAFHLYVRHRGWLALSPRAFALRTFGALSVLSLVGGAFNGLLGSYIGEHYTHLWWFLLAQPLWAFFVFFVWISAYFAVTLFHQQHQAAMRELRLEKALQAAELRALKSQLNPHFLFNSMNGIRSLIADDPARARTAVTELSRTLRYALRAHDEEFVPLAREFAIVDDYLALETLRLGDRLTVLRDVAEGAGEALIPTMLLQTLVENAIKHGIARLPDGGTLGVAARIADGALVVRVDNPRPLGAPPSSRAPGEGSSGIGLSNARERLRLLLGADANIELDLSKPDCATARLRIPQGAS